MLRLRRAVKTRAISNRCAGAARKRGGGADRRPRNETARGLRRRAATTPARASAATGRRETAMDHGILQVMQSILTGVGAAAGRAARCSG